LSLSAERRGVQGVADRRIDLPVLLQSIFAPHPAARLTITNSPAKLSKNDPAPTMTDLSECQAD
jgi:hypothetical protein